MSQQEQRVNEQIVLWWCWAYQTHRRVKTQALSQEITKRRKGTAYPTVLVIAITTSREIVVLAIKRLLLKEKQTNNELCKIKWDVVLHWAVCGSYLVVLAHGYSWRWVLACALLTWHPLAGVIGRWQGSRSVRVWVLSLLTGKLAIRSKLLSPIVRLKGQSY